MQKGKWKVMVLIQSEPFYEYTCSTQSENLRNLEIALYILRIPRLRSSLKIVQPILRLHNAYAQSTNFASTPDSERCVACRMEDSLDKASIGLLRSGRVSNAVC